MKNVHARLTGIAPRILFPLLMIFRKKKKGAYLFLFIATITLSSCYLTFFRTNTKPYIDTEAASRLKAAQKYFIIHFADSIKGLEDVYINGDSLYGKAVLLPAVHAKYLDPDSASKKNRVKRKDKTSVFAEVHLYTNTKFSSNHDAVGIKLSSFYRSDVYELNKSFTRVNTIISTVGVVATSTVALGALILAISCNCPQVYVENNGVYNYTSGLYSGAVYSTMERMDYLPLTTLSKNAANISFRIANAADEEQFINKAALLQVNHRPGLNVLPDRHGNMFTYQQTRLPLTAVTYGNNDIKNVLRQTDKSYYTFESNANINGFSDAVLSFDKPADANKAKLIINARNTSWAGLLHKEFLNLFGENFEQWRKKQEHADPKELEQWQTDQALPLMVYKRVNNEWKFVDYFPFIGNTATRDMIMEINTADITGDTLELKLETAYRLWDIDFAGIDYSADEPIATNILSPAEMLRSDSTDQSAALLSNDKVYTQLTGTEYISFKYTLPAATAGNVSSYFIVSGGYYHNLEPITGKTNYKELYKFRRKGAFDKYSREKYKEAQEVAAAIKGWSDE